MEGEGGRGTCSARDHTASPGPAPAERGGGRIEEREGGRKDGREKGREGSSAESEAGLRGKQEQPRRGAEERRADMEVVSRKVEGIFRSGGVSHAAHAFSGAYRRCKA
eukprot:1497358-Rhodomonas_salina.2